MRNRIKQKESVLVSGNLEKPNRVSEDGIADKVREIIEPMCNAEGFELVHVEYRYEAGGRILRMYIDKPGGVTLDDCVYISRQAGDILDVGLENDGSYNLEVSSPGFDRPLVKPEDFERFKGSQIRIKIEPPMKGRRNFKGILLGIFEETVKLMIDNEEVDIPFQGIAKARLVDGQ